MKRVPFLLLLNGMVFFLGVSAQEAPASLLDLEAPGDYQVYQRQTLAQGSLRFAGTLHPPGAEIQCQVVGKPLKGILPAGWQTVPVRWSAAHFTGEMKIPAGGWYRLVVRAVQHGKTIGTAVVDHVGVGEVFVVAGQSNATNYGAEKQRTATGRVASFDGAKWALANDPQPGVQDGSTAGSFLPAFGDALATRLGVPIGVACTGAGATSVREWLPRGETMNQQPTTGRHVKARGAGVWECDGQLYNGLMKRIVALGPKGFRGVLWHQGESDAGQARAGYPADRQISGKQYEAFMETLLRACRKQAGWDVPWFVAQATYHSEKDPADTEFRQAQEALWKRNLALQGPDTDALRAEYRAGVHFNAKGLQAHGRLWADKVGAWVEMTLTPSR